ncbi:MAG: lipocalin family protein [Cyclobacteriaceae bacterium]
MTKNLLSFAFATLLAFIFSSCSDDTEKELSAEVGLIGTWTLQSADVAINGKSLDEFVKELAALMGVPESEIADSFDMDNEFETGTTIEFKEDGTYVAKEVNSTSTDTGLWTATDKTVTITDADGSDPLILDVKSLTSNKAVFYMMEEESENGMTMKIEVTLNLTK